MDFFVLVPAIVIGVFLWITWHAISPVRFLKQMKEERLKKKQEWEELQKQDQDLT